MAKFETTNNPRTIWDYEQNNLARDYAYRNLPDPAKVDDSEKVIGIVRKAVPQEVPEDRQQGYKEGSHWFVRLRFQGRMTFEILLSQGSAHHAPPTTSDILYALFMDATGVDQSFEDWASDLGFDEDSRKAKAIYDQCVKIRHELRKVLPALFEILIDSVDEEVCDLYAGETCRPR